MSKAIPTLADLAKEYRPSMDREILHSWAADVVAALSAGEAQTEEIYRFLREGDIIEATDEFVANDCREWQPPGNWAVGMEYPSHVFKTARRRVSPPAVPGEVERENAKLVELIKTRFLGVHPDELDCYLEYDDWTRILSALSVPLEGGDKGDGWQPADTAPQAGFFLAWSPDHPELVMTWKAEIFHQARKPGTPRHLSANHFTLWMPIPLPGGTNV